MEFRTLEFVGPSGHQYSIREQNGADEEILSNAVDAPTLMNLTKFIAAIVVSTDFTANKKLTIEDALSLPVNDRYCILFKSRIFSLGEEVEFEYDWGKSGKVHYAQDLREFVFDDYGVEPTEQEMEDKPEAIPYYPHRGLTKDMYHKLASGKEIMFDLLTGEGEQKLVTMPLSKQTLNSPLLCRNLRLNVNGNWEKVENFTLFSPRDMAEIRKAVLSVDPVFNAESEVTDPITGQKAKYPILMAKDFFYLTEA